MNMSENHEETTENTEQPRQCRGWLITIKAADHSEAEIVAKLNSYDAYVGQLERGERTGYLHWQIYLHNNSPVRFTTLKRLFPTAHLEARRGTVAQAVAYVTKEDTRAGDQIRKGEIDTTSHQGERVDIAFYASLIRDHGYTADQVIWEHPQAAHMAKGLDRFENAMHRNQQTRERDVEVYFLTGKPGVGKTHYVMHAYPAAEVYRVTDYKHPFDAYTGQSVLVLDEYTGQLEVELMLNLMDRYAMDLPARYNNRIAQHTTLWIVSNKELSEVFSYEVTDAQWPAVMRRLTAVYQMPDRATLREIPRSQFERRDRTASPWSYLDPNQFTGPDDPLAA